MNAGPFRDTLTPLIEEAQRQLAELQRQREGLETRHRDACKQLDRKEPPAPPVDLLPRPYHEYEPAPPGTKRKAFIIGLVTGLITWLPILGRAH
jgi:hypothetical protein